MNPQLVTFDFQSHAIPFTADAHVNLTQMCAAFGKRPSHFLGLESTNRFLLALAADTGLPFNCRDSRQFNSSLIATIEGSNGGTWAHPDLALECARWLSPDFAIWTNRMIRQILSGDVRHSGQDMRAFARLDCKLKELNAEAAQLRRRMMRMHHVEGNVSVWAYLQAAQLNLSERTENMRLARACARLCAETSLPVGRIKQRGCPGSSAFNRVCTFPPSILCRVLCSLGFKHTEPPLQNILAAWPPMLFLLEGRAA